MEIIPPYKEEKYNLTIKEMTIFKAAFDNGGFVSHEDLEYGFGTGEPINTDTLDVNMTRIRDKDPKLLINVKNEGIITGDMNGLSINLPRRRFTRKTIIELE